MPALADLALTAVVEQQIVPFAVAEVDIGSFAVVAVVAEVDIDSFAAAAVAEGVFGEPQVCEQ
jgi:hypothetical protein